MSLRIIVDSGSDILPDEAKELGVTHLPLKVVFNGGIDSTSSIKSFKWLTQVDTSALESQTNVVDTFKNITTSVGDDIGNVINSVKNQKDMLKNTATELKNLFR